ncbi:hypothetical protein [Thaumasiovibrio subtropicus]|uniref:hypothetical protein n=1 Tax=Thaumasiovibrio subtropicus TaxID=1891207 RepID=UPI00131AA268|nr:hypothetical protein [Thaumasiovibrio subtropicus]
MTNSMFWLVAVVAAHGVLEWSTLDAGLNFGDRVNADLWHIKLGIVLVVFALLLAL